MEEVIITKNLTKMFGSFCAVNNLNLTIEKGEVFALLGVNGAGKTTTIKMLSCLSKPTSGEATIAGFSILKDSEKIKQMLNVSPQETAVAPNLTVKENIRLIADLYGLKKSDAIKKTDDMIQQFNLGSVENKSAKLLSGGMQRRLSIAMALVSNPQILFLDEPTLGLDVLARQDLWDIINNLKGKITILLTTHYMEEAESLASKIGIMSDGKLVACDTLKNLLLKTECKNLETAFIKIAKENK